uniref:Uncharacterized protein n=1 Tax=Schistocephalus solidus TaxID=70667 RepID=A0A0X3PW05_SCHSO
MFQNKCCRIMPLRQVDPQKLSGDAWSATVRNFAPAILMNIDVERITALPKTAILTLGYKDKSAHSTIGFQNKQVSTICWRSPISNHQQRRTVAKCNNWTYNAPMYSGLGSAHDPADGCRL